MIAPLFAFLLGQLPPPPTPPTDLEAPIISDLAAAASSPDAAPVITVNVTDAGSGVGNVVVHYRAQGKKRWERLDLTGDGGLYLARLPDGLQRTGFEYWVTATDVAGNGPTRIGSDDRPISVAPATVSTARALAQRAAEEDDGHDPLWAMVAIGAGVVAGASAGLFAVAASGFGAKTAEVTEVLKRDDLSSSLRTRLVKRQSGFEDAALQQTVIASTLGGIAVLSVATGVTLLVLGELE